MNPYPQGGVDSLWLKLYLHDLAFGKSKENRVVS